MEKKGQIWVETVTYTLVAFVLISLILSFAKPKIEELQDQTVIQQSIDMIKDIDQIINEVGEQGLGNKRKMEINIKKGEFEIISLNNTLMFSMQGRFMYSQPGQEYNEGSLEILTEENGRYYDITIEKKYTDLNITYNDQDLTKKLSRGTNPYVVYISNEGGNTINFEIE